MPESTQSFTLDDLDRQRIFDATSQAPLAIVQKSDSLPPLSTQSSHLSVTPLPSEATQAVTTNVPVFDYSYSQKFSQTQEDTASLRQQVDNAPYVERNYEEYDNPFDDMEELLPLETSTAITADLVETAPITLASSYELEVTHSPDYGHFRTPVADKIKALQTPAGLTQMFQSSQDTPVLRYRKSTYVSMKDSQENRLPTEPPAATQEEEDPDFSMIRQADRLRDRSSMHGRGLDGTSGVDHVPDEPHSPAGLWSQANESMTVPATAPQHDSAVDIAAHQASESDYIITDSQPQCSKADPDHGRSPSPIPARVASSPVGDTLETKLHSTFPVDARVDELDLLPRSGLLPDGSAAIERVSTISDEDLMDIDDLVRTISDAAAVSQQTDSATLPPTLGSSQDMQDSGAGEQPIPLQGTPSSKQSYSTDLTKLETHPPVSPLLRRSVSASLPSTTTPAQTSAGMSLRSKSMHTPFNLTKVPLPEYSSPIIQAGHRRRSHKPTIIAESPLAPLPQSPHMASRKRELVMSSLPDEDAEDVVVPTYTGEEAFQPPRKRIRTANEVHDSQALASQQRHSQAPPQPAFDNPLQDKSILHADSISIGWDVAHDTKRDLSSPLSDLYSEDLLEPDSPETESNTKEQCCRVFALHETKGSYWPGTLNDQTHTVDEDSVVSVHFDTFGVAKVASRHIRPLDLQLGDCVKVNVPGIVKKQWIVVSLHADQNEGAHPTDIHGHTNFRARLKDNEDIASFKIGQLYLPPNLWKQFVKRPLPSVGQAVIMHALNSPSKQLAVQAPSLSPSVTVDTTDSRGPDELFKGLAISITLGNRPISRDRLIRKIVGHGGELLTDGLLSLFESDRYSESHDIAPLRPTKHALSLSAAFVIADNPSRTAKYLQALSLSLPCLHYSFIDDCVNAKQLLDPQHYLLAAGEARLANTSMWLSMSCRYSLDIGFSLQISSRRRIWGSKRVIVVCEPQQDARQVHFFLSWAMGCLDLTESSSFEEAYHLMMNPEDGKRWDLISVHQLDTDQPDLRGRVVTNEDVVQSLITGRLCTH